MTVSAKRFDFLEKDTNIPIADFGVITDNKVYSAGVAGVKSVIQDNVDPEQLKALSEGADKLKGMLTSPGSKANIDLVDGYIQEAMDRISDMELPEPARSALDSLKSLDSPGLRSFVSKTFDIGSSFLCSNLDLLKNTMTGYSINKNIMSALAMGLLLTWLDRFCKARSAKETEKDSPVKKVESVLPPYRGATTQTTAFKEFTKYYRDDLSRRSGVTVPTRPTAATLVTAAANNTHQSHITSVVNSELTAQEKTDYLTQIDTLLLSYPAGSDAYLRIIEVRRQVALAPPVSAARREAALRYQYLNDKLGLFSQAIAQMDLSTLNTYGMSEVEASLFTKLKVYQTTVKSTPVVTQPDGSVGSFNHVEFAQILPTITAEEEAYLLSITDESDAHRLFDLHPTSSMALEAA